MSVMTNQWLMYSETQDSEQLIIHTVTTHTIRLLFKCLLSLIIIITTHNYCRVIIIFFTLEIILLDPR